MFLYDYYLLFINWCHIIFQIQEGASGTITWTLQNWKNWHKMLAGETDCTINIGDVKLRFFFRLFNKKIDRTQCNPALTVDYYSLCVQILSNHKHISLRIKTKHNIRERYSGSEEWKTGKASKLFLVITISQIFIYILYY